MKDAPDFRRWTAQRPPVGFADATVDAILASETKAKRRHGHKRWPGLVILAAALVGSAAWATLGSRRASEGAKASNVRLAEHVAIPTTPPRPMVSAPQPSEDEPPADPPAAKTVPRRASAPPPATASASVPTAPPAPTIVHYPRCECQPHISFCSCIE